MSGRRHLAESVVNILPDWPDIPPQKLVRMFVQHRHLQDQDLREMAEDLRHYRREAEEIAENDTLGRKKLETNWHKTLTRIRQRYKTGGTQCMDEAKAA